jgi:transcription elongation factor GreB
MNKALTHNIDSHDKTSNTGIKLPIGVKNYITPNGFQKLQEELDQLWKQERPILVKTITWAASNGDRSENGDYIYGKKKLREIDRRVRFLRKRLECAEVVDPAKRQHCDQVFFGATVTVCNDKGDEHTYSIVGVDEANATTGKISWVSPLARALLKLHEGDTVTLQIPTGNTELEICAITYQQII